MRKGPPPYVGMGPPNGYSGPAGGASTPLHPWLCLRVLSKYDRAHVTACLEATALCMLGCDLSNY